MLSVTALLLAAAVIWQVLPLFFGDPGEHTGPAAERKGSDSSRDTGKEEPKQANVTAEAGFIQGNLGYPSSYIPEDMKVCAVNLDTGKEYWADTAGKTTYRIELPPGRYHVYACTNDWPGYHAYYNEFVKRGMTAGSEHGDPIEVVVKAGQTTDGVDPIDWYDIKD